MKHLPFLLATTITANAAIATEKPATFDEQLKLSNVVVTATRMAEEDNTSASISVFTRVDIERLRPSNVLELLTHVPGVQVATYGGKGALYGLYIRGTSTTQSLVLIDGVRVGSATAGMASLQYLSVDQIERIEVLRGARSAIYGSDALGGVVQIFTRRGEGAGVQPRLRIAGGNLNTWETSAGISGGNDATRYSLQAAFETTDGFDRTQESWPSDDDNDSYKNRSWSFNVNHRLNATNEAGISVLNQVGKTHYDNPFGAWYDDGSQWGSYKDAKPFDEFTINSVSAYLNSDIHTLWKSRLEAGYSEDKQENFDALNPSYSKANSYRHTAQWFNTFALSNAHSILIGLDYLHDSISTTNGMAVTSRYNHAVVAQYQFTSSVLFAELGGRYDHNEQFGEEFTYNATLGIHLTPTQRLVAMYSEGFRAPTFNDLYYPGYENPNLLPETSKTYELKWVKILGGNGEIEATVYRTDLTNMIGSIAPLYIPSNINQARIDGAEASVRYELLGMNTQWGLSLIDPTNTATGKRLPNRAQKTAHVDIDKQWGTFGLGLSVKASGDSYADASNTLSLSGYAVVDVRANWQASHELSFDLKLANLFDKNYHRFSYNYQGNDGFYQESPFTVMLGVTWTPSL